MISRNFDKLATIKRLDNPTSVDEAGSRNADYETHIKNLPGAIRELTGKEVIINSKRTADKQYRFYCGVADIKEPDILILDTKEYEILNVNNLKNRFLQIDLQRRE